MTYFITVEEALEIVRDDRFHVADAGLFSSAILRPQMSVFGDDAYPSIWLKAAALLESLARNHVLADGNRRSATRLTALFLRLNGWRLKPNAELGDFVVSVASGETPLADSALWLEDNSERTSG